MNGEIIGDTYRIEQEIGSGGWSSVYKATHIKLGHSVAIKILSEHLTHRLPALERFHNEARIVSQLSHPNIVNVVDYGVLPDGRPFIVMELVNGQSLSQLIAAGGPLNYQRALPLFMGVCAGLAYAHDKGILHRDIKPGNVIVLTDAGGNERAMLLDFGLAKVMEDSSPHRLTQTGETIGTISYMSPEQCQGANLDKTSDIYSLGCLMYETLSGVKPFIAENVIDLMDMHLKSKVPAFAVAAPRAKIPAMLEDTIMRTLEKSPEDRFQSVGQLSGALKQELERPSLGRFIINATEKAGRSLSRTWRSPVVRLSTLIAVLVCGVGTVVFSIIGQHRPVMYVQGPNEKGVDVSRLEVDAQNVSPGGDYVSLSQGCTRVVNEFNSPVHFQANMNNIEKLTKASGVLLTLGRYAEAKRLLEICITLCDQMHEGANEQRVQSQCYLGRALAGTGDRKGAEAIAQEVTEKGLSIVGGQYKTSAETLSNLGMIYEMNGDCQKAIDFYGKAIGALAAHARSDSANLLALQILNARAMSRAGQTDKAISLLKQVQSSLNQQKDAGAIPKSLVWAQLGAVYERRGDENAARDSYEEAIKEQSKLSSIYPQFPDMLARYSAILRHQHYDSAARQVDSQVAVMNESIQRHPDAFTL